MEKMGRKLEHFDHSFIKTFSMKRLSITLLRRQKIVEVGLLEKYVRLIRRFRVYLRRIRRSRKDLPSLLCLV